MALTQVSSRPVIAPRLATRRAASTVCAVAHPKRVNGELITGAALAATILTLTVTPEASADTVDTVIENVTSAVTGSEDSVRAVVNVLVEAFNILQQAYKTAEPTINDVLTKATPLVQSAIDTLTTTASPLVQQAAPEVKGVLTDAVRSSGVDVDALQGGIGKAGGVADSAVRAVSPFASSLLEKVSSTSTEDLSGVALPAAAALFLSKPAAGILGRSFQGYSGDITPANALDLLETSGTAAIVDIRSAQDKERNGVLDVPSSASGRVLEIEFAATENRQLRGSLRNPDEVETTVTAMQIASAKKLGKGSSIIILGSNVNQSKAVAKQLSARGFKKVYVLQNGFKGWTGAKLQVKPSATVFQPTVIGQVMGTISSRGRQTTVASRKPTPKNKALPSGRK